MEDEEDRTGQYLAAATAAPSCVPSDDTREALRERAFSLSLQGMRPRAIAFQLGVGETTVRRWLRAMLATLAEEDTAGRAARLAQAIESQRAIARAAWEGYEREQAALREGDGNASASSSTRFLALTLAAQREVARLQGLYQHVAPEPANVSITITRRPEGPENQPLCAPVVDARVSDTDADTDAEGDDDA